MTGHSFGRFAVLLGLPLLAGCGPGGWFGGEEVPPLPGTRISILELAEGLEPDPLVADLTVAVPPPSLNLEWPQAGGRPDHAPGNVSLSYPLEQIWSADVGTGSGGNRRLLTAPIAADGRLFVMDADGHVQAVDAETGRRLWRVRVASPDEDSVPLGGGVGYANGRLYATTGFGEVMAVDPANGGLLWRAEANGPIRSAPTIAGGRVFVVGIDNQLEAMDAATGELMWSHTGILEDAGLLGGASPAVGSGIVVAPYSSGEVYALRVETGRPIWSDSLAAIRRIGAMAGLADIRGNPVIAGDMVIAISHSGRMVAIDVRSGIRVWEQSVGGVNMPLVAGEFVFVLTNDAEVVAMTRRGGRILWVAPLRRYVNPEERAGAVVWAGPVLAGDRLIAVGSEGEGVVLSPRNGEITETFRLRGESTIPPIVANGTLYVLSDNATLTAYR